MATTNLYAYGSSSVTVANPSSTYTVNRVRNATSQRALDGTLIAQQVAHKYTWDVYWEGLTSAEKTTLMAELDRSVKMTWKPPEGSATYTVLVTEDVVITPVMGLLTHWNIKARIEEV